MHITDYLYIEDLPQECIDDCSQPGSADSAVDYWLGRLEFTVDRARAIACLAGYGAWSDKELRESHDGELASRVLWIACSDFHEQQVWEKRHPDKAPEDSDCGSSCFCLE